MIPAHLLGEMFLASPAELTLRGSPTTHWRDCSSQLSQGCFVYLDLKSVRLWPLLSLSFRFEHYSLPKVNFFWTP